MALKLVPNLIEGKTENAEVAKTLLSAAYGLLREIDVLLIFLKGKKFVNRMKRARKVVRLSIIDSMRDVRKDEGALGILRMRIKNMVLRLESEHMLGVDDLRSVENSQLETARDLASLAEKYDFLSDNPSRDLLDVAMRVRHKVRGI